MSKHSVSRDEIDLDVIVRFYSKTERDLDTGCLIWTGRVRKIGDTGYEQMLMSIRGHQRNPRVVAWYLSHMEPYKQYLGVDCMNPRCVSPAHIITFQVHPKAMEAVSRTPYKGGKDHWNYQGKGMGRLEVKARRKG